MEKVFVNNKEGVPLSHYAAIFKDMESGDAVHRTGAEFDGDVFTVEIFAHKVYAQYPEFKLLPRDGSLRSLNNDAVAILIIRWLIEGKRVPFNGKFLSYREVPWGEVYDRNFEGRCRRRLAGTFGNNIPAFRNACEKLGGMELKIGDASYDLPLPGGNTLRLILREGDEDFPPTAQILFSDNIVEAWSAEDLAVLGEVAIRALVEVK